MARDRRRAKQRRQRREPSQPRREGDGRAPEPRQPLHRENVPGPVEHTGEVDEFEAALVAGAGGQPEAEADAAERAATGEDLEPAPDVDEDHDDDAADAGRAAAVAATGRAATPDQAVKGRGGSRFLNFLKASWAELQRVQWPDRRQVGQATMVVLGFVVLAGAFLGFADFVAEEIVDLII